MKRFALIAIALVFVAASANAGWLINEDFEGGTLPSGWSQIDANEDDMYFYVLDRDTHSHSGTHFAFVDCYTNDGDDWLILPEITPAAGDSLSFFARAWYDVEDFEVRISTDGDSQGDFDTVIDSVDDVGDSYVRYAYDLSAYAGQSCYIAIRWIQDTYGILIDDVMVGQAEVPVDETSWSRVKALYR